MNELIDTNKYKAHIYDVIGAIHEVHKELGPGLNEYCYQEGMQMQLQEQGLLKSSCGILVNFASSFATIERYFYNDDAKVIFNVDGKIIQFL